MGDPLGQGVTYIIVADIQRTLRSHAETLHPGAFLLSLPPCSDVIPPSLRPHLLDLLPLTSSPSLLLGLPGPRAVNPS